MRNNQQKIAVMISTLLSVSFYFGFSVAEAVSITEEQATAILEELRQIRQLLERQQTQSSSRAPAATGKAILKVGGNPSLGQDTAPVILVEFTDFECPFCKKFHDTTFPELKRKYIDTGYVRYISRDLP